MACLNSDIKIEKTTKEKLDNLKIHNRQSYNEVIIKLIREKEMEELENGN